MPIVSLDQVEDLSGHAPLWEYEADGYRFVLFSGNRVQVFKGDSNTATYTVDEHGCSCPAAQYGNSSCKHRSMFKWLGDGANNNQITEEGEGGDAIAASVSSLL